VTDLQVGVLGPLEVVVDDRVEGIRSHRCGALLAFLALHVNEVLDVDVLADELWDGRPPRTAEASLRNHVAALRRTLPPKTIETHGRGYLLRSDGSVVDAELFEAMVSEARQAEPEVAARRLREALGLWRGRALADFVRERWAQGDAARLEELRLLATQDRITADLELGREADLVPELEGLVRRHPLAERLWRALMLALYRTGRQAEALATYRRAHKAFVDELGIEPGPELTEMQRAILVQDPLLAGQRSAADVFDRASALLPTGSRARAEALMAYASALWRLGERGASASALRRAAAEAVAANDRGLEELVRLDISWHETVAAGTSPREHLRQARRAIRRFRAEDDDRRLARALFEAGRAARDLGFAAEAADLQHEAVEAATRTGEDGAVARYLSVSAMTFVVGPQPVETGLRWCETAARSWRWDVAPTTIWISYAVLLAQAGREDEARDWIDRGLVAARDGAMRTDLLIAQYFGGLVELAAADYGRAARHLEAAVDQAIALGGPNMVVLTGSHLVRALDRLDDLDSVVDLWPRVSASATRASPTDWSVARQAEALLLAGRGRFDAARRHVHEAVEVLEPTDWLVSRAEAHEDAAAVEAAAGREKAARTHLRQALELYDRKGHVAAGQRLRAAADEWGAGSKS
jgi:DNA-binding SARP family transcriptional activator